MQILRYKKVFTAFLLMHYLFIGLSCSLFHNHEEDFKFHDTCPACQWEVQSQNPDTALTDINNLLEIQIAGYTHLIPSFDTTIHSQTPIKDHLSRAPPFSS